MEIAVMVLAAAMLAVLLWLWYMLSELKECKRVMGVCRAQLESNDAAIQNTGKMYEHLARRQEVTRKYLDDLWLVVIPESMRRRKAERALACYMDEADEDHKQDFMALHNRLSALENLAREQPQPKARK